MGRSEESVYGLRCLLEGNAEICKLNSPLHHISNSLSGQSHGISILAAMLLISMPIQDAFIALVNLINNTFLKHLYEGAQDYVG